MKTEQTEFTIFLLSYGSNQVGVIKAVHEITGLGLKESQDVVKRVPVPIKESVSRAEAEATVKKLQAAGAKAEMR